MPALLLMKNKVLPLMYQNSFNQCAGFSGASDVVPGYNCPLPKPGFTYKNCGSESWIRIPPEVEILLMLLYGGDVVFERLFFHHPNTLEI